MSATLQLTVPEFDHMIECGAIAILGRKIELVRGKLRQFVPTSPQQNGVLLYLNEWSQTVTSPDEILVAQQTGLNLSQQDSCLFPDLMWIAPGPYLDRHPNANEVELLIEVSQSSFSTDIDNKASLYAEAEIADYWLIDAEASCVHIFRNPKEGQYVDHSIAQKSDIVAPLAAPRAVLKLSKLFATE